MGTSSHANSTGCSARRGKIRSLSVRLKFLSVSLLLCVALAGTIFAAVRTVQAYQQLEQDHQQLIAGDVSTIRSWMTLPYIARVYRVPSSCLFQSLHVSEPTLKKYATLRSIADYYKKPVNVVIRDVQVMIQNYRHHRVNCNLAVSSRIPFDATIGPPLPGKGGESPG